MLVDYFSTPLHIYVVDQPVERLRVAIKDTDHDLRHRLGDRVTEEFFERVAVLSEQFHEWPVCLRFLEIAEDVDHQEEGIEFLWRHSLVVSSPGEDGNGGRYDLFGMIEAIANCLAREAIIGCQLVDDVVDVHASSRDPKPEATYSGLT